ncbi:MAG: hypothetical protein V4559_05340 [Pseudomonadota bacterium]
MTLENLEPLIGRWIVSGDATGVVTYRWAEGRRFLFQDFELHVFGRDVKGLEVIGRLQPLGAEPSPEIWSRAYVFSDGRTLDYVYEMTGGDLTIWFRHKGSDNFLRGHFSGDGRNFQSAWQWPGGGYRLIGSRAT